MDVLVTKIVVLFLLCVIQLISGCLPIVLTRWIKGKGSRHLDRLMGAILCIGGGVLLSTVFLHMVPEVRESLEHAQKLGYLPSDSHYPFAELTICLGFFMIYAVETVTHKIFKGDHGGHSHGIPMAAASAGGQEAHELRNGGCCHTTGVENGGYLVNEDGACGESPPRNSDTGSTSSSSSSTFAGAKNSENVYNVSSATLTSYTSHSDSLDTSLPPYVCRPQKKGKTGKGASATGKSREMRIQGSVRNFLVIMALSLHGIFEGMAVGLQLDSENVWKLFAAIEIHSIAIGFCIGVDMISSGTRRMHIFYYMLALSLISALGVGIGIVVTQHVDEQSGVQTLVIGVLQGLAGGTLLYITFYEVMNKDKLVKTKMTGMMGLGFLLVGFAFMAGLEALGGHDHNHGGGDGHDHNHGGGGHDDHSVRLGQSDHEHEHHHHHHEGDHGHNGSAKVDALHREVLDALDVHASNNGSVHTDHSHSEEDPEEGHAHHDVEESHDHDGHDHEGHDNEGHAHEEHEDHEHAPGNSSSTNQQHTEHHHHHGDEHVGAVGGAEAAVVENDQTQGTTTPSKEEPHDHSVAITTTTTTVKADLHSHTNATTQQG